MFDVVIVFDVDCLIDLFDMLDWLIVFTYISQKFYWVGIHPKCAGWFTLRGVLIFSDTQVPSLPRSHPVDIVLGDTQRIELLERYNFNWKDWSFRDVVPALWRYWEEQKLYFVTPPGERVKLLTKMKRISLSETWQCAKFG